MNPPKICCANYYGPFYAERDGSTGSCSYRIQRDTTQSPCAECSLLLDLVNSTLDFVRASEETCIGNFMVGYDVYDFHTGCLFRITLQDCYDYILGRTVTLQGREPDLDDCQRMAEYDPDAFGELPAEKVNTLLYQKLYDEHQAYLAALRRSPPQEIISQAARIADQENILLTLEVESLEYPQAEALLQLDCPLERLYEKYSQINSPLGTILELMQAYAEEVDETCSQPSIPLPPT